MELTTDDLIISLPEASTLGGETSVLTEDVNNLSTADETGDNSISDSNVEGEAL